MDASGGGVLMAFDEPTGFAAAQAIVVSIEPTYDETMILVGDVVRVERGADFRTYVAMTFRPTDGAELRRWEERLASPVVRREEPSAEADVSVVEMPVDDPGPGVIPVAGLAS